MSNMHPLFRVEHGGNLRVDSRDHVVVRRLYLERHLGISRVLLWTATAQGFYFLMASGPNYFEPEILGYIPVEVSPHDEGLVYQGEVYRPVHSEDNTWLDAEKKEAAYIYECFAATGADILVVAQPDGVQAFAHRSRYHWQTVR